MGRIVVEATIENGIDSTCRIHCDALVDTGAAYLTLPKVWQTRLGQLTTLDTVEVEPADGQYEPLIGSIPLEQAQAAVDRVGHRLVKVSRVDLK